MNTHLFIHFLFIYKYYIFIFKYEIFVDYVHFYSECYLFIFPHIQIIEHTFLWNMNILYKNIMNKYVYWILNIYVTIIFILNIYVTILNIYIKKIHIN